MNRKNILVVCLLFLLSEFCCAGEQPFINPFREGHNANLRNGLYIVAEEPQLIVYDGFQNGKTIRIYEEIFKPSKNIVKRPPIKSDLVLSYTVEQPAVKYKVVFNVFKQKNGKYKIGSSIARQQKILDVNSPVMNPADLLGDLKETLRHYNLEFPVRH